MASLALIVVGVILLIIGVIIFSVVAYQGIQTTNGQPLSDLQWWLFFISICLLLVAQLIFLLSDPGTSSGVESVEELGPGWYPVPKIS